MKKSKSSFILKPYLLLTLFILHIESVTVTTALEVNITHPKYSTLRWDGYEDFEQFYLDENVAFYLGEEIPRNLTWPFRPLSAAWSYATKNFGPMGLDPTLYILLRIGDSDYCKSSHILRYFDEDYDGRSVIHCIREETNGWDEETTFNMGLLLQEVGKIILRVARQTGNWPASEIEDGAMAFILNYDLYLGIGRTEDALRYLESQQSDSNSNRPNKETRWLRDWYYPIYANYGGTQVLSRFFALLYENWPRKGWDYKGELSTGEFVHFWSGAAGVDLTCLAARSLRWSSQNQAELYEAKQTWTNITYLGTIQNNSGICFQPPLFWKERWKSHKDNLTLVFSDDNVALYFDNQVPRNITWPFKIFSAAWNYSKVTYEPFGLNPILYIVLHIGDKSECLKSKTDSYWDIQFKHRNVIDCTKSSEDGWNDDSFANIEHLIQQVGQMIPRVAKETGNWPAWKVSRWSISSILTYDIYLGIGKHEEANSFLQSGYEQSIDFPRRKTYWLRDWFQPIYSKYGGKEVLNRFFKLLYLHWERKNTDYKSELNVGEFVHFWSGAAGKDLTCMAIQSFGLNTEELNELHEAKESLEELSYSGKDDDFRKVCFEPPSYLKEQWDEHDDNLTLVFSDDNVAFYFDHQMPCNITWPFKILSDAWGYSKSTYGPFGSDPILYIVLHIGNENACWMSKRDSYWDSTFRQRNVIDCMQAADNDWNDASYANIEYLMEEVGQMIPRIAKETGNWPAYKVSRWSISLILTYDIYLGIGRQEEANSFLQSGYEQSIDSPRRNTYWFRDWFQPIYSKYGGREVLNRFFKLLQSNWGRKNNDYKNELNVGDFVHFWSGAAGEDLTPLAELAFGFDSDDTLRFLAAKKKYFEITYRGIAKDGQPTSSPVIDENIMDEFGNPMIVPRPAKFGWESPTFLLKTYSDSYTTVYYGDGIHATTKWPFFLLSSGWKQAQNIYKPGASISSVPASSFRLALYLHRNTNEGCEAMWKPVNSYKVPIIDCGTKVNESWNIDSESNRDQLLTACANLIQSIENDNEEINGNIPMTKMIVFDLYLQMGRLDDAYRWLKYIINMAEMNRKENNAGPMEIPVFKEILEWNLPIYIHYGGGYVLNKFLLLLQLRAKRGNGNKEEKLNQGELIHFWNTAAGANLLDLRKNKDDKILNEFNDAQKKFSTMTYSCVSCNELGDQTDQNGVFLTGVVIGVSVVAILLVTAAGAIILYRRKRKCNQFATNGHAKCTKELESSM